MYVYIYIYLCVCVCVCVINCVLTLERLYSIFLIEWFRFKYSGTLLFLVGHIAIKTDIIRYY